MTKQSATEITTLIPFASEIGAMQRRQTSPLLTSKSGKAATANSIYHESSRKDSHQEFGLILWSAYLFSLNMKPGQRSIGLIKQNCK